MFWFWIVFPGVISAQQITFQTDTGSVNFGKVIVENSTTVPDPDQLRIYLQSEWEMSGAKGVAILGKVKATGQQLIFSPLLPFRQNQNYVATYPDLPPFYFSPKANPTATALIRIYPSADTLPANLLKFYLYFSTPMSIGNVYRFIRLEDETGKTVPQPFLEMQTELWDSTQQRLTLWLDPGRIKRGLQPNLSLGQPLIRGGTYTLTVNKQWKNAAGISLTQDYQKTFYVKREDRKKPDINTWKLTIPPLYSLDPLRVHTFEYLDAGSAEHAVALFCQNQSVRGEWSFLPGENGWQFHPKDPWQPGTYQCSFDPILEDLAGNNLKRLFDQAFQSNTTSNSSYQLSFRMK